MYDDLLMDALSITNEPSPLETKSDDDVSDADKIADSASMASCQNYLSTLS